MRSTFLTDRHWFSCDLTFTIYGEINEQRFVVFNNNCIIGRFLIRIDQIHSFI